MRHDRAPGRCGSDGDRCRLNSPGCTGYCSTPQRISPSSKFEIADPAGKYHVPMLLSPYAIPLTEGATGDHLGQVPVRKAENRVVRIYTTIPGTRFTTSTYPPACEAISAAAHVTGDQSDVLPTDTQNSSNRRAWRRSRTTALSWPATSSTTSPRHGLPASRSTNSRGGEWLSTAPSTTTLDPQRSGGAHGRGHGRRRRRMGGRRARSSARASRFLTDPYTVLDPPTTG